MIVFGLIGVIARVDRWAYGASFWSDEAFLLINLRDFGLWRILTGRLDAIESTQAGPPVFLAFTKLWYEAVGLDERLMRLPFLLAGIAAIPLTAIVARKLFGWWPATACVAMVALSDRLIFHSNVVKQYAFDVVVALTLLAMVAFDQRRECSPAKLLARLSVFSALAVWVSHPVIFLFAGVSLALLVAGWKERGFRAKWLVWNGVVGVSFSILYMFSIRVQRDDFLSRFWTENGGFPGSYAPGAVLKWFFEAVADASGYMLQPLGLLLFLPVLIGVVSLIRQRAWVLLGALVLPGVLTLLAALLRLYPYQGTRLILFLAPAGLLLAANGAQTLHTHWRGPWRWGAWVLVVGALGAATGRCVDRLIDPRFETNLKQAIAHLDAHRSDEPVFVYELDDLAVLRLYRPALPVTLTWVRKGEAPPAASAYWLVFSARLKPHGYVMRDGIPYERQGYTIDHDRSLFSPGGATVFIHSTSADVSGR